MTTSKQAAELDGQVAVIAVTSRRVGELMEMTQVTLNADHPPHERNAELQRLFERSAEHLGEMHRALGRVQAIERFTANDEPPLRVA